MQVRKIDVIFKKKLSSFSAPVSEDSWDKMNALLDESNHGVVRSYTLLKVAASVVFFMFSFWYFVKMESHSTEMVLKESKPAPVKIQEQKQKIEKHVPLKNNSTLQKPDVEDDIVHKIPKPKSKSEIPRNIPLAVSEKQFTPEPKEVLREKQDELDIPKEKNKKRLPIRITYKRGSQIIDNQNEMVAERKTDTVQKGKIQEFFLNTKEDIEKSALWADVKNIREKINRNSKDIKTQNSVNK
ncbi:MAG: hypothetical protein JXR07_06005 [Reichenbachiella sp.]